VVVVVVVDVKRTSNLSRFINGSRSDERAEEHKL
jgi:hypothetical protein